MFEIKSRWKRCCGWELDEGDDLSSYKWCASILVGFALGKAGAGAGGTKFKSAGNVPGRAGGAARGAGGSRSVPVSFSSGGVAAVRGRRPMLTKC